MQEWPSPTISPFSVQESSCIEFDEYLFA